MQCQIIRHGTAAVVPAGIANVACNQVRAVHVIGFAGWCYKACAFPKGGTHVAQWQHAAQVFRTCVASANEIVKKDFCHMISLLSSECHCRLLAQVSKQEPWGCCKLDAS